MEKQKNTKAFALVSVILVMAVGGVALTITFFYINDILFKSLIAVKRIRIENAAQMGSDAAKAWIVHATRIHRYPEPLSEATSYYDIIIKENIDGIDVNFAKLIAHDFDFPRKGGVFSAEYDGHDVTTMVYWAGYVPDVQFFLKGLPITFALSGDAQIMPGYVIRSRAQKNSDYIILEEAIIGIE